MKVVCPRPDRLEVLDRWAEFWRNGDFCDLTLSSSGGDSFRVHRVAIALASEPLAAMLKGGFIEGAQEAASVALTFSSGVLAAVIRFIYEGEADISAALVPEALKFAHMYCMRSLHDGVVDILQEQLDADVCSLFLVDFFTLGSPDLQKACKSFAISNFEMCCRTEAFKAWPAILLFNLLESDLAISKEEDVLVAVLNWYAADKVARKASLPFLFRCINFPLLASATLTSLQQLVPSLGPLGSVLESYLAPGFAKHKNGANTNTSQVPRCSIQRWWVDIGCSSEGGDTVLGSTAGFATSFQINMGGCFIADMHEQCITRRDLSSGFSVPVAGNGAAINGINEFNKFLFVDVDANGHVFVSDSQNSRVVKFSDGHGEVVASPPNLAGILQGIRVSSDGTVVVLDEGGCRVCKISEAGVEVIAGGNGSGSGASQIDHAHHVFSMPDGALFISDTYNHRVQKWTPGAAEGITVVGGNGAGHADNQLNKPLGLFVTKDETIYVADGPNHRIMKWRKGQQSGLLAAGGYGAGQESYQLNFPVDVVMDEDGALYVLDGNLRVTRWHASPLTQFESFDLSI